MQNKLKQIEDKIKLAIDDMFFIILFVVTFKYIDLNNLNNKLNIPYNIKIFNFHNRKFKL